MRSGSFAIFFLLFSAACSANNAPIEVYEVVLPRTEVSKAVDIPISSADIRIEPMVDVRSSQAVAILKDQQILPKSDLSEVVSSSVSKTLAVAGFRSSSYGSTILLGEIKKFFATFEGNFPSEGEAEVVIGLFVKDPNNRSTYNAEYKGTAKLQTFMASADDVSELLESALQAALRQMIRDRSLLSFLRVGELNRGRGNFN